MEQIQAVKHLKLMLVNMFLVLSVNESTEALKLSESRFQCPFIGICSESLPTKVKEQVRSFNLYYVFLHQKDISKI